MKTLRPFARAFSALALAFAAAFTAAPSARAAEKPRTITIGLVAKSQGNPVFQAARIGAQDAAKTLGAKLNLNIKIDWRTPNEEDAQKQAEAIEQLVLSGAEGIAVLPDADMLMVMGVAYTSPRYATYAVWTSTSALAAGDRLGITTGTKQAAWSDTPSMSLGSFLPAAVLVPIQAHLTNRCYNC